MVSQKDEGDGDDGPAEVGGDHDPPSWQAVHHHASHEAEQHYWDDFEDHCARHP
jgi:hypothetical protein